MFLKIFLQAQKRVWMRVRARGDAFWDQNGNGLKESLRYVRAPKADSKWNPPDRAASSDSHSFVSIRGFRTGSLRLDRTAVRGRSESFRIKSKSGRRRTRQFLDCKIL